MYQVRTMGRMQTGMGNLGLVGLGLLGALTSGCADGKPEEGAATSAQALTGSFVISGLVTSSRGPVLGATVTLTGSENRTAFSDSAGRYSIPGLGSGSYQVVATAGTSCTSGAPVTLNNMNASTTVGLGLTGSGCASFVTVPGPQGPQGPAGANGPIGPIGPVGPIGPIGPVGAVGPIGPVGAVGPIGPVGAVGPIGPIGPVGAQGVPGVQGVQGVPGVPGVPGPEGAPGAPGAPGTPGAKGDTGAPGPQGPVGDAPPLLPVVGSLTLPNIGQLAIRSFSQHVDRVSTVGGGSGGGTGKVSFSAIDLVRDADFHSPDLNVLAAEGKVLTSATIALAAGQLTIQLQDVWFENVSIETTQSGVPQEHLAFGFNTIKWAWTDGGPVREVQWDVAANKGGSGGELNPDFVFFGPGVATQTAPDEIPFTKLTIGTTVSGTLPLIGKASFNALTMLTAMSSETVPQLGAALTGTHLSKINARFLSLDEGGAPYDRVKYSLSGSTVTSLLLATTPTGSVTETLGFDYQKIEWSGQPQSNGASHQAGWDVAANKAF